MQWEAEKRAHPHDKLLFICMLGKQGTVLFHMQKACISTQPDKEVWQKRETRQTEVCRWMNWFQRHVYWGGGIVNHANGPTLVNNVIINSAHPGK
jgi:hypothetical protein